MIYPKGQTNYYFLLHCNTLGQVMYPSAQFIIYNTTPYHPYGYITYPLVQLTYPFVLVVYPLVYTYPILSSSSTIPYSTPIHSDIRKENTDSKPIPNLSQTPKISPQNAESNFQVGQTASNRFPLFGHYLSTVYPLSVLLSFSFQNNSKRTNIEQTANFYPKQSIDYPFEREHLSFRTIIPIRNSC